MSRLFKNKLTIAILAVVVLGALVFVGMSMSARAATPARQATQVTRGDIQATVLSSAALQPASDLSLTFGAAGTIASIAVKPGDHVTKGQALATLDTSDLELAVTQAQANLGSAQAKLESVKAGAATKDIANAQDTLRAAQAKLDALHQGPTTGDLATAQAALVSAQAKLASVKAGATTLDLANAQSALKAAQAKMDTLKTGATTGDLTTAEANLTSAKAKLNTLKAGLTTAQRSAAQLKVTQAQTSLNKTTSSASVAKQQAEIALDQADHGLKNAQDKYFAVAADALDANGNLITDFPLSLKGKYKDLADLTSQYNTAYRALQDAEDSYKKAQLSLDDARRQEVQSVTAAQAQLDDAKMQLADLQSGPTTSDLSAAQSAVDQAQNSLDKLKAPPTASDLATAQSAIDQAQNNLDKLKAGPTDADVKAAQASVAQAQANLDKLKAPPSASDLASAQSAANQAKNNLDALKAGSTATDLATAQAAVEQAQANLDSAKLKLNNATLKAPFTGIIANVPVTVGQTVAASGTAATVVELVDNSAFHLDMNVGEADVSRIKVGQPVDVTFDALSGEVYTGTVTYVSPKADIAQGVVTYLATVTLDPKAAGGNLRPGMSATASAIVQERSNVLLVPNRAIHTQGRQKVVSVVGPTGAAYDVAVQTGISNGTSTEITSDGLQEGDAVVISTSSASTAQQRAGGGLINLGGGGARRDP